MMSEGGVLRAMFRGFKLWLGVTQSASESRRLREQIEEEKRAERERKPKEA